MTHVNLMAFLDIDYVDSASEFESLIFKSIAVQAGYRYYRDHPDRYNIDRLSDFCKRDALDESSQKKVNFLTENFNKAPSICEDSTLSWEDAYEGYAVGACIAMIETVDLKEQYDIFDRQVFSDAEIERFCSNNGTSCDDVFNAVEYTEGIVEYMYYRVLMIYRYIGNFNLEVTFDEDVPSVYDILAQYFYNSQREA